MGDLAIRVDKLGKKYQLSGSSARYKTLRDQLARWVSSPGRWFRRDPAAQQAGEFWALRDVSFEIRKGEVVGIIGRNGAGKSTLLKILSRITEPTEGETDLYGRVGSLLEVGTGFHPELSGRENVFLNGAILGMKRAEILQKFDEIVAFAEVEKFIDTPVKHYSSGMYMRLAFAVAAHLEPEILIVDEVLAVGDAEFQKKCLGKMGDVSRQGRTVLLVSHNLASIIQLCGHCLYLREGRVVDFGDTSPVVSAYLSAGAQNIAYVRPITGAITGPVIAAAEIVDPPNGMLQFNDTLTVDVKCRVPVATTVAIEIVIRDEVNHPIIFVPSGLRFGREFPLVPDRDNVIRCRFGPLPLAEGNYSLDLLLSHSGQSILDRQEGALQFRVVTADPCGLNLVFTQQTRQGCIHVDASYSPLPPAVE